LSFSGDSHHVQTTVHQQVFPCGLRII